MSERGAWPQDTRGIVDPSAMQRLVDFARYPAGPALEGIVDWFWSVSWSLPDGMVHDQAVLNHPSGHVSIGTLDDAGVPLDPARGRVYGVLTGLSNRRLSADGWTVAAKTTVGGLGVLIDRPARDITDGELDLAGSSPPALPGLDGRALVSEVIAADSAEARVDRIRTRLAEVIAGRSPDQVVEARRVAEVAAMAEHDRTVCRVEQLAEAASVSVRSLQRLFDAHVGVSPSWVVRRWRIIEAAEAAIVDRSERGTEPAPRWSDVSARLGYADQSHLIRDFKRHLGTTPADYVERNRTGA